VFESIDELINSDAATTRKRFAVGGFSSVIIHVLVYSLLLTSAIFVPGYYQHGYKQTSSGEDLVEIAHVIRLPLPPTPRVTPATQSRPTGNAMVEREVISTKARTDEDKKGETSRRLGPEPPAISNLPSSAPAPASGPVVQPAPIFTEAPPPPEPQKVEQQPELDADKIRGMVRRASSMQPGAVSSGGGGGQKGTRIEGGAGVDIGENKVWIERRIQNIWRRTKSGYSELQRSGRTVVVYFDWYRDGRLVFVSFGTTTGNPALDNEARNAVQNSSPFNPIPKEITLDVIHLNATFTY